MGMGGRGVLHPTRLCQHICTSQSELAKIAARVLPNFTGESSRSQQDWQRAAGSVVWAAVYIHFISARRYQSTNLAVAEIEEKSF